MTHFRFTTLVTVLASATLLAACNTAPTMPMGMGAAANHDMTAQSNMGKMDAQMKNMQVMHEKMMKAKNSEERSALMADHMKVMQDSMAMMGGMQGKSAMSGDMPMQQQMMDKRMEMMKSMMLMMQDRMPSAPAK